ncbi:MAG: thiamine biosynthesis protein ThiF [Fibrobacter sp.]|nr:thiamine biosynthesis protein ThiF [Fibrobacter sp.]
MSCGKIPSREEFRHALVQKQGEQITDKLAQATVAVCGLGGLGSNVAINLARAGIKKLILVDFDCVEVTNLQRQQYKANQVGLPKAKALVENLKEIAPYVELESYNEKITEGNIDKFVANAEVVCEAFDNPEAKSMFVNEVLEKYPQKYLVAASGMAGLDSANSITTRKISKRFYLCGDGKSDVTQSLALLAPRVQICAAHQALTIIRILAGLEV